MHFDTRTALVGLAAICLSSSFASAGASNSTGSAFDNAPAAPLNSTASAAPPADASRSAAGEYDAADKKGKKSSGGEHEIRFSLDNCPSDLRPKITGTSASTGQSFKPNPAGSVTVPADFIGSIYLIGEGSCGKKGAKCQNVDVDLNSDGKETVPSYVSIDSTPGHEFYWPVTVRFDDTPKGKELVCKDAECYAASRDPDDFISNRLTSAKKGVGLDIIYDCKKSA